MSIKHTHWPPTQTLNTWVHHQRKYALHWGLATWQWKKKRKDRGQHKWPPQFLKHAEPTIGRSTPGLAVGAWVGRGHELSCSLLVPVTGRGHADGGGRGRGWHHAPCTAGCGYSKSETPHSHFNLTEHMELKTQTNLLKQTYYHTEFTQLISHSKHQPTPNPLWTLLWCWETGDKTVGCLLTCSPLPLKRGEGGKAGTQETDCWVVGAYWPVLLSHLREGAWSKAGDTGDLFSPIEEGGMG